MKKNSVGNQSAWLAFAFISGASGLIYEVIWHRYLAILLGSQAKATSFVLMLFFIGMGAGYLLFGYLASVKKWNVMRVYIGIELALACWALVFPSLFHFVLRASPGIFNFLGIGSMIYDLTVCTLLVGLPSILLGGTLPLFVQSFSGNVENATPWHSRVYGWNTVGAATGSLVCGYVLLPTTALPIILTIASVGNLVVAFGSYFLSRGKAATVPARPVKFRFRSTPLVRYLLAVALVSGFCVVTCESVFTRYFGLAVGSSPFHFSLVISIFVFGLGIGSLSLRNRTQFTFADLFRNLLGIAAGLYVVYFSLDYWAYAGHLFRIQFRDIPQSFYLYQFGLGLFLLGLLILPVGLAGRTLPLLFHFVKDTNENLGMTIGVLYAVNVLGCVLGAFLGGYALHYLLNLDQILKLCLGSLIATAAGGLLLNRIRIDFSRRQRITGAFFLAFLTTATFVAPAVNRNQFLQPFRASQPLSVSFEGAGAFAKYLTRSTQYLFYQDGPTATIGVGVAKSAGQEMSRTIFVNGKSDGNTLGDLFTTSMLGHLPGILAKRIERACVIGFGTGITVGSLTLYSEVKEIDVVEISESLVQRAELFDHYNFSASKNSKVQFHQMDAFRYLYGGQKKLDLILSEPSNPWVTGIENLYSSEFFSRAAGRLEEDGMFVQWIHTYSFNDDLLKMVIKTMGQSFPYVSVFQLKGGDLALIGKNSKWNAADIMRARRRFNEPAVRPELERLGLDDVAAVYALEVIPPKAARSMAQAARVHTLENAKLSAEATRAFYSNSMSKVHLVRREHREFFESISDSLMAVAFPAGKMPNTVIRSLKEAFCESSISQVGFLCDEALVASRNAFPREKQTIYPESITSRELSSVSNLAGRGTSERQSTAIFTEEMLAGVGEQFELYKKYQSPVTQLSLDGLFKKVENCLRQVRPERTLYGECLLQKVLMLEHSVRDRELFIDSGRHFIRWFNKLPRTSPNYAKFSNAESILARLLALSLDSRSLIQ